MTQLASGSRLFLQSWNIPCPLVIARSKWNIGQRNQNKIVKWLLLTAHRQQPDPSASAAQLDERSNNGPATTTCPNGKKWLLKDPSSSPPKEHEEIPPTFFFGESQYEHLGREQKRYDSRQREREREKKCLRFSIVSSFFCFSFFLPRL